MAEILKPAQRAEHHRVTEVQIGRRGISAELDDQRPAALELRAKLGAVDDIDRTTSELRNLAFEGHDTPAV